MSYIDEVIKQKTNNFEAPHGEFEMELLDIYAMCQLYDLAGCAKEIAKRATAFDRELNYVAITDFNEDDVLVTIAWGPRATTD